MAPPCKTLPRFGRGNAGPCPLDTQPLPRGRPNKEKARRAPTCLKKNIHGFDGRSALATWLHRIVVNAALMRLRARRRQREDPLDELMPAFDANGCRIDRRTPPIATEALLRRQEVRDFVRAAIDRLPESSRTVLLLRDIEGYSIEEAARLLETTPGAVKMRLHRARAALKKLLEPIIAGEAP